jgi:hypothetical protein
MAILIARLRRREYDDAIAAGHKAIELAPVIRWDRPG